MLVPSKLPRKWYCWNKPNSFWDFISPGKVHSFPGIFNERDNKNFVLKKNEKWLKIRLIMENIKYSTTTKRTFDDKKWILTNIGPKSRYFLYVHIIAEIRNFIIRFLRGNHFTSFTTNHLYSRSIQSPNWYRIKKLVTCFMARSWKYENMF